MAPLIVESALSLRQGAARGAVLASFTVEANGLDGMRNLTRADVEARLLEYRDVTCGF